MIQFSPQGEAQIVTGSNTDSILQWIEIDLVPTHGRRAAGLTLSASYSSAEEALGAQPGNLPDVVLMDINLPLRSGIDCVIDVKTACPKLQILILTASEDSRQIFAALRAGASG